ncbi:DUF4190 domain-containing protein [Cellulomonas phragmiteti]|uniref:DUF4190 domain-containing protein n=1 Tax=Cellulomonas phragmiteti TaxID=478780 RepID=A0ABQ4DN70_9CELL|nr:DUF4190 domain-containing protein [Cellulomonas phragmiteti]GIG40780.1 hypothetical protein Cph01nite_25420 [Cellulomonas phragmiteti]
MTTPPPGPAYGTAPGYGYGTAPAYGPPPGYGPPLAPRRTNAMAVAAFVSGLLGFAVVPVVLGHVALRQIRRSGDSGGWMAVVGLVLGYGTCLLYALLLLGVLAFWGAHA